MLTLVNNLQGFGGPPYGKKSAVGQKMGEKSSKEELNLATGKSTQFVRA